MIYKRIVEIGSFPAFMKFGCLRGGKYPCGKCYACLKKRSNDWVCRLNEEHKHAVVSYFVTLTYDDFNVPHVEPYEYTAINVDGTEDKCLAKPTILSPYIEIVSKRDIQLWLKRFRKLIAKQGIKLRYFISSEYGPQTFRPHYHCIMFFDKMVSHKDFHQYVLDTWLNNDNAPIGNIQTSTVTHGRMCYCAKYTTGITDLPEHLQVKEYKPFMLCSRMPGIGHQYLDDVCNRDYHASTLDMTYKVHIHPTAEVGNENELKRGKSKCLEYGLPTYYKYKLFDKFERHLINMWTKDTKEELLHKRYKNYYEQSGEKLDDHPKYYTVLIDDQIRQFRKKSKNRKNL